VRVKSLQDHARDLDLYGRGTRVVEGSSEPAAQASPQDALTPTTADLPTTVGADA
jgi:hypothetical protein